jgi:excisionase family DNA binding protein
MSRPVAVLAETRATRREVAALAAQVERLTVAVEALRGAAPSQLGRVEDACRILNVSPATLHRRIADGSIKAIRHGRVLRFDLATLTTTDGPRA